MEINIVNLEKVLKKCTLNYHKTLDFAHLVIHGNKIRSSLVGTGRDVVTQHTLENNVLLYNNPRTQFKFSFMDIKKKMLPTLQIMKKIDSSISRVIEYDTSHSFKIENGKLVVKFIDPMNHNTISYYDLKLYDDDLLENYIMRRQPRQLEYFATLPAEWFDILLHQKSLAKLYSDEYAPYGKFYFQVDNKNLNLLIGDLSSTNFENVVWSHRISNVHQQDFLLCFDYGKIENLLKIAKKNYDYYRIKIAWNFEDERGMLLCYSTDNKEKYFFFSRAN